jgi:DNA-binding transcriptional LysR family regulator
MELRQLQSFVAVAEELHFGRAAERLHIVQPAVSQQLRRLEAELGVTLVERSTRRVALTDAGRRFLPEARATLAAAERARAAVARSAPGPVTLRLGTSTGLGGRLPILLAGLRDRAPDVVVDLARVPAAQRLRDVADGALDAALVRGAASHPGLRVEEVWTDEIVVALPAAHPLATTRGAAIALAALRDLPLRLPPREANPPLVDLLTGACRAAGFEPRLAPAMNDQDMLAAIAAGPPTWTVYYAAQADALTTVPGIAFRPLADPRPAMATVLATRASDARPEVAALRAAAAAAGRDGAGA